MHFALVKSGGESFVAPVGSHGNMPVMSGCLSQPSCCTPVLLHILAYKGFKAKLQFFTCSTRILNRSWLASLDMYASGGSLN